VFALPAVRTSAFRQQAALLVEQTIEKYRFTGRPRGCLDMDGLTLKFKNNPSRHVILKKRNVFLCQFSFSVISLGICMVAVANASYMFIVCYQRSVK
jgi:hypothetical protein